MRNLAKTASVIAILWAFAPTTAHAQTGPKMGKNGGIGASGCTFVSGEPTGGGGSCTYSISGTTGVVTASDIGPSKAKPTGATVSRTMADHLVDVANPVDFGAIAAGGSGDSVTGPALVKATKSTARYSIWSLPYRGDGYVANADPSCTDPVYCYTGAVNPGTLRNEAPGIYFLNNNTITGTMGGEPENGLGTFNSTYTNPYNVTTNLRMQFDPAAIPSRGPNVTYQGLSLECLPQRPNANDSAANLSAKKRGAICAYMAMDTGTGGAAGTHYGSEVMNMVLNQDTNSGNALEINHNFNGQVADGQYSRTLFITGGGNYQNLNSSAIEINHGLYGGGYAPYGTGVGVRGAINQYWGQRWNSSESGNFFTGFDENMVAIFNVDKQANIAGHSLSIRNASLAQVAWIDGNGYIVAAGVESAGNVKADVTFQAVPVTYASLNSCAAVGQGYIASISDSTTATWGATISGGGSNKVLAYCNGTNWTVMGK